MPPCDATRWLFLHGVLALTQDMQEGPSYLYLSVLSLGLELGLSVSS